jgi:serine protease
MSSHGKNRLTATAIALVVAGVAGTAAGSLAQVRGKSAPQQLTPYQKRVLNQPPLAVPGEVVVRLASGANLSHAQSLAAAVGGSVKRKLRFAPNTYVLQNVPGTEQAINALHTSPAVIRATKNHVFRPSALPPSDPNDSLLQQQWALKSLGASNLWGITVGQRLENGPALGRDVLVGLIDGGPQVTHPDLADNFDTANAFDFTLDAPYDESTAFLVFETHGTSVAGCIAPLNNNGEGIAGLPWEGVKILPCVVTDFFNTGTVQVGIPVSAVVDAVYYCIQQQCDVINMSFGLSVQDALVAQAILDAYNQGIPTVASSGDGFFFSRNVEFPALLDEPIAVGAVGASNEPAAYSNAGPEVDVAAPGGNDPNGTDLTRQVLVAIPTVNFFNGFFGVPLGYAFDQGTSYAAGHVSGLLATLISQGARNDSLSGPQRVEALRTLLQSTARNPFNVNTPELGAGIVSADRALRSFSQFVDVIAPAPNDVTASITEPLEARIVLPGGLPLADTDFQVLRNGQDVSADVTIVDPFAGLIEYTPSLDNSYLTGINSIDIIMEHPSGDPALRRALAGLAVVGPGVNIPARAFRFRVRPRIEYPGLRMWSIPYELDASEGADTLEFLFGGSECRLARWAPSLGRYAIFNPFGSPEEPEADLTTDDAGVVAPPVGVGFWLRVIPPETPPPPDDGIPGDGAAQQVRLQVVGRSERRPFYNIPLVPGFNQIGNPYPFRVPFNLINVRFGNEVMSVQEAASRNLMRGVIWRYEEGRYTFKALPSGELVEWESHWIQSFANLTLIVPRVSGASQISAVPQGPAAPGGWAGSLRLQASGRLAGEVTLGQAPKARNGHGPEDVPLPPAPLGQPELRVRHHDWGGASGAYTADIRAAGAASQRWDLEVATSTPGRPVKLAWSRFPRSARAVLTLNGRKQAAALDRDGSLTFTPQAGVQRLTVTTYPHGRGT